MVTNLEFLKEGGIYPPTTEVARLAKYQRYDDLFYGKLASSYESFIKDKTRDGAIQDAMKTIFTNPRIMNYPRAITKKTIDLMISKTPSLLSTTEEKDNALLEIARETRMWKKIRLGMTDVSRYGNGYLRQYNKIPRYENSNGTLTEGDAACNVINPKMVTKIVNPLDKEDIIAYVVGWIDEVNNPTMSNGLTIEQTEYYLTTEIHYKGEYEYRRFRCATPIVNAGRVKQWVLQEDVTPENMKGVKYKTGLKGFAIIPLIGYTTSDNPNEGLSEYDMFDSLVIDLCERVSQLSEVFEKHGNPSMQGSENLLSTDEDGNPIFYAGDFYPLGKDDQPLTYITWDAKSKEIIEYCNQILQQIFMLADMGDGSIMGFTNSGNSGFAESGKAIRMRMASPLMKVQALITDNNDEIINMIVNFSDIMGKGLKSSDIEIKWQDGLPIDWVEETNMFNARVTSGTESIKYGLQRRFGMTPQQAEDELQQIIKEKSMVNQSTTQKVEADTRETTENRQDAENAGTSDITQQ